MDLTRNFRQAVLSLLLVLVLLGVLAAPAMAQAVDTEPDGPYGSVTTQSIPPTTQPEPTTSTAPEEEELPFTGGNIMASVAAAVGLTAVGLALLGARRRRAAA